MAKSKTPVAPKTTSVDTEEPIESGSIGPDPVIGLRVTAQTEGFRRAGRAWSRQPTEIPLDGLSDADVAALMGEPMLTVEDVVLP